MTVARRTVLGAAGLGVLAACTPDRSSSRRASAPTATSTQALPFPQPPAEDGTVSMWPGAGTRTASATTEISLRGPRLSPASLGRTTVTGASSGRHEISVRPHADHHGVGLVLTPALTPGEQVEVRTDLAVRGARAGLASFQVARAVPTVIGPDNEGVDASQVQVFSSAPELSVPKITVETDEPGAASGRIFVSPYRGPGFNGPMLLDDHGALLWALSVPDGQRAANFRAQTWRGAAVLTWWQGQISKIGDSTGVVYMYDEHYHQIAKVVAGNGFSVDLHDFVITPQGTALLLCYVHCRQDLSAHGGPKDGVVIDCIVQEVEIETAHVLFEWHALDHVDLAESYQPMVTKAAMPYDAYHLNSVTKDGAGNYLVSSRSTHALYLVDGRTGAVRWRLGGKRSNFTMKPGSKFSSQHDARWVSADVISLFDNGAGVGPASAKTSRALVIRLDQDAQTATVESSRQRAAAGQSQSQGNVETLPDGHLFVGWGSQPYLTEFDATGAVVFAAALPSADQSYRAFRLPWTGRPQSRPDLSCVPAGAGHRVAMSWNGATSVVRWQVLSGARPGALSARKTLRRSGFETETMMTGLDAYVAVRAVDGRGQTLATSDVITT